MNIVYGAAWVGGFFVVGVLIVWVVQEARLARRFTAAHPGVPVTEVYALAEDVHDLEGLREVGTLLASPQPTP